MTQIEKEVDQCLQESSSDFSMMSDQEREQLLEEREREYNFREMYKKYLRKQKKSKGDAPDPKVIMRQMILSDSKLIKLRTGKSPISKEVIQDCQSLLNPTPDDSQENS